MLKNCSRCGTPTVPAKGFRPVSTGAVESNPSPILYGIVALASIFVLGPWLSRFFGSGRAFTRAAWLIAVGVVYAGHRLYLSMLNGRAIQAAEQRFKLIEPMILAHPEARICPMRFQLEIEPA